MKLCVLLYEVFYSDFATKIILFIIKKATDHLKSAVKP